jgi:hypothetical protein
MPSQIAAAVFAAVLVAGCEPMPTPETALLKPQPPPRCDAKSKSGSKATGSDADLSRLEYEAQCYRHAEMIVRNRLSKLQKQVRGVASTSTSKAATATE